MKDHLQRALIDMYGERVAFVDPLRPPGTGKLTRGTAQGSEPDAVVFPASAQEVVALVRFSTEHRLPLVPRGAATSGYGGELPVRGGIIVDFSRMKRVLAIDREEGLVTVEPGIPWLELDWALREHELTLRVYPSSGRTATVGGWVAAGGVGIGSYQYGPIDRNVEWAEVVLPEGRLVRLSRENLILVAGTQGISGLIVALGLPVRPLLNNDTVIMATFRRLSDFLQTLVALRQKQLPLWHVSLISAAADGAEEGARIPLGEGQKMELPLRRHTAVFAFAQVPRPNTTLQIRTEILSHSGVIKSRKEDPDFWQERWERTGLGYLGPCTANGSVMIPTIRLEGLLREVRRQRLPVHLICNLSTDGWTSAHCISTEGRSLPEDALREWLNLAWTRGALPYGVDALAPDAGQDFLGPDLYEWLVSFKRRQDPYQLMNPGKVLPLERLVDAEGPSTLDHIIHAWRSRLASVCKPDDY